MPFSFTLGARDPRSRARRGTLRTSRGTVETPVFMPVGTRATVTGVTPDELVALGASIILANTYHLLLRPGPEQFRRVGGILAVTPPANGGSYCAHVRTGSGIELEFEQTVAVRSGTPYARHESKSPPGCPSSQLEVGWTSFGC